MPAPAEYTNAKVIPLFVLLYKDAPLETYIILSFEGSTTGLWTRGFRVGSALASTSVVYTTNTTGNHPDLTKAYLVSQCYNLTNLTNPEISFKMAFDLEINWDIVYVQYSTDSGQNWQVLGVQGTNWYNSNRTPQTSGSDCYNCVGAQWTGTDTTLRTYNYSLASLESLSSET